MSSDISLGGLGRPATIDHSTTINNSQRVGEASPVASDLTSLTPSGSITADLNSTSDIKNAELQGRKVAVGEEELIKAIEKANKAIQGINTTFEFKIHEATKQIMVKVLNKETGEVVREIPNEKILDMVASLWEKAGIIIDERR